MRYEAEALFIEAFVERVLGRDPAGPEPDEPVRAPERPGPILPPGSQA